MPRRVMDLSLAAWALGQVDRRAFGPAPADDRHAVAEWLPAVVPGDVRADLIRAGRIPEVDTPEGIAAGEWVDRCDWWYRLPLQGGYAPDEQVLLELDGVDYYSAIWLDGDLLSVHQGMFARRSVLLSPQINAVGEHELAVRVWGAGALPQQTASRRRRVVRGLVGRLSPGTEFFPERMATPKAQFSFGWDFSPRVLSAGIWDDARLVVCRGAYIEDLWVRLAPAPGQEVASLSGEPCRAVGSLRLNLRRWTRAPLDAEVSIDPLNFAGAGQRLEYRLDADANCALGAVEAHELSLDLPAARLWWPWDQGEPCLYEVTVRLSDDGGPVDEARQVTGVRTVTRERLSGGAPWLFTVNGRPVFLRGANWAPADVLPGRVSRSDYDRLLRLAREAGVNFLRVWGGGLREKSAFWDICDRTGILAWQEFPLACAFLDHYPRDAGYLAVLSAEATGIVRALRHHPSLLAWCGGNEIHPERERLPLQAIASAVRREDPTRPWIPASPSDGAAHLWDVWHGFAPWSRLADITAPFLTEFGLQALPDSASVAGMFEGKPPAKLDDGRWAERKAQAAKLLHYGGPAVRRDLESAIVATQRAQAAGLQVGLEACRIRRPGAVAGRPPADDVLGPRNCENMAGGSCGGVAVWQFNEPWPGVTWALVDRAGRPKLAFEMLRRGYQPILVAARFPWRRYRAGEVFVAEVWLVNDGPELWNGCQVEAALDDAPVWGMSSIALPGGCACRLGRLRVPLATSPARLDLKLHAGDLLLAENCYDLAVHLPGRQPVGAWLRRRLTDRLLGAS